MEGYKEIIITREKSPWGSAVNFTVLLDGKMVGILRNGTTISAYAQDGPHTLLFQKVRKIDCSISILISPEDTAKVVNTGISGSHLVVYDEYTTNTPETAAFDNEYNPKSRERKIKNNVVFAVVIIVAVLAAVSLTFGNFSHKPSGASSIGSSGQLAVRRDQPGETDDKSVGIDGTIHGDCFDISIADIKWTNTLETSIGTVTPEDTEKSLLCITFLAKNITDSTENVANIGFNAYVDGKKVLPKVVVGSVDGAMVFVGAVSSGMELVGFSVWELPTDWKEFQTSYIDAGTAVESEQYFVISREDIN